VAAVGPQNWKMIATDYLGEQRSDVQCLHRWQKVLQPGLVKGPWTKEEDQIIIDCIDAGITKWSEIAERIPGRIGKQCRERWFNHLDPSLKKGNWTEEEDAILVEAQAKWGNCWTKIAKLLPGRSENAVKNRWNSATRRRAKASQGPDGETKYLENLGDPHTMFPDGLDTTASAVLAAARAAAAKIIAEESGKIEPEDDDPDTIKLSHEAKTAMLMKRKEYHQYQIGESSDDHLLLDEDGKPLIFDGDGGLDHQLLSMPLPPSKDDKKSDMDINSSDFFHIPEDLMPKSSRKKVSSTKKKVGGRNSEGDAANEIENEGEEGSSSFLFFEDQNLTEREKDLIHRAYLAGLASKADPAFAEALKSKGMGRGSPSRRNRVGGAAKKGSSAVQWDFNMEGSGSASGSGSAFGMEHVLNQHLDEDDPSLNHSLLNMR
jgi:hypothetical protein